MRESLPALRYDWAALDHLRCEYGEDYTDCLDGSDLGALAALIAAGCDKDAADIYAESPPVNEAIGAVSKALSEAFNGPNGLKTGDRQSGGKRKAFLSWITSPFRRLRSA